MVRLWAAAMAALFALAPAVAEARQHGTENHYWTEGKAAKVHRERSVLSGVAKHAMSAVVSITTTQPADDGKPGDEQTGLGSGFIIHPDGYILTSAHVIDGASDIRISVLTPDGFNEDYEATLVGQDKSTDFALLKIEADHKLPVLPLGSGADVDIADWVVVIGNPFGLGHSVSVGVVSYKGRTDVTPAGLDGFFDYIQTDAAINPGNSGGPVLDLDGNVVAIANAVNVSGQGIGFAIPIDVAKSVIPHLVREGKVRRGWVGISIQDLTPETASEYHSSAVHGVLISDIAPDSPAEKAGLRVGDVIIGVDNVETRRAHALRWRVSNKGVGRRVKLKVDRGGHPVTVSVLLAEKPSDIEHASSEPLEELPGLGGAGAAGDENPDQSTAKVIEPEPLHISPIQKTRLDIGATVTDVNEDSAHSAGLARPFGALISSVDPDGIGQAAGLLSGDVVVKVNKMDITSREDLLNALESTEPGGWVRMFVRRHAETHALTFRKP